MFRNCHHSLTVLFVQSLLIYSSIVSSWRPSLWKRQGRTVTLTLSDNEHPNHIHSHFMKLALDQARQAETAGEVPIGAVLVQEILPQKSEAPASQSPGNNHTISNVKTTYRILASAGNRVETLSDASAHAELQVLRSAAQRLDNWRLPPRTTLYSTLEPCPMCLAACQAFRLSTLVYGAPDVRLGAVTTHLNLLQYPHPYHNLSHVVAGVCQEESATMLRAFFRKRRSQNQGKQKNGFVSNKRTPRFWFMSNRQKRSGMF